MTTMPPPVTLDRAASGRATPAPDFAVAFAAPGTLERLAALLGEQGKLTPLAGSAEVCETALAAGRHALVFLDFSGEQAAQSARLARQLTVSRPEQLVIAVGLAVQADSVLAALRAGASDFIDLEGEAGEAQTIVRRALATRPPSSAAHSGSVRGRVVAVLGARGGVGTTSTALNFGWLAQRALGAQGQAMLLDFGMPVADGALYVNQKKEYDLLEAVHNMHRFDPTYIGSAFARTDNGLTLLPLPGTPQRLREVAYDDALSLLARLRSHFQTQVVDLGGLADLDFVAAVARNADEVLLVCDPSAGAIVSARTLLQGLGERGLILHGVQLLLNKHDEALLLSVGDVAERLGIQPLAALPHRHPALTQAINDGRPLAQSQPKDPWVRALEAVVTRLAPAPAGAGAASAPAGAGWGSKLRGLMKR